MQAKPKSTIGGEAELTEGLRLNVEFLRGFEMVKMLAIVWFDFLLHYIVSRFYCYKIQMTPLL